MRDPFIGTALVTGASSGVGATYADGLAHRGFDLVLVARDKDRLEAIAGRLRGETGVAVEVVRGDLTVAKDLGRVEARLRQDARIDLLINNAGALASGGFADPDLDVQEQLIRLNVTAVTRLAGAAIPRFLAAGRGSIINVASVLALAREMVPGIYAATKAFVLNFSQSLQAGTRPPRSLCPGGTAGRHANRDLGTVGPRHRRHTGSDGSW
jgi:short-subunit dehydrogenase